MSVFCLSFCFGGGNDVEECLPFKTRPVLAMMFVVITFAFLGPLSSTFLSLSLYLNHFFRCWGNPNPFVVWVSLVFFCMDVFFHFDRTPCSATSPRSPPRLFYGLFLVPRVGFSSVSLVGFFSLTHTLSLYLYFGGFCCAECQATAGRSYCHANFSLPLFKMEMLSAFFGC